MIRGHVECQFIWHQNEDTGIQLFLSNTCNLFFFKYKLTLVNDLKVTLLYNRMTLYDLVLVVLKFCREFDRRKDVFFSILLKYILIKFGGAFICNCFMAVIKLAYFIIVKHIIPVILSCRINFAELVALAVPKLRILFMFLRLL